MFAFRARRAWLLSICAGCGGSEAELPSAVDNVVLITLDTTRADALACYGGPAGATPHLSELAAESLRFENARSVAPLTLPAHASMLTGLVPPRHGVRNNGLGALPASAQTLAESCRSAGMDTGAFVSALVLDKIFGLDQGFDTYAQPPRPERETTSHYARWPATETLALAERWLDGRASDRRFFLWVHFFDPHLPYEPEPAFLAQAGGNAYLGEVAAVDDAVGRVVAKLEERGRLERTLVIVIADHGESLGEHGERTHGALCYDATLLIPFLVRFPDGWRAGAVAEEPVYVADVLPTALAALDLPVPSGIDGLSLFGSAPPRDRGTYCECYSGYLSYGWSPLAGWCREGSQYLASSCPEYYDLVRDPRELRNVIADHAADVERDRAAMAELLAKPSLAPDGIALDAEMVRELRLLGYAASGDEALLLPSPLAPSELPCPLESVEELEPLLVGNALIDQQEWEQALPLLHSLLKRNPRHRLARDLQSLAWMQLGRFEEAEAVLRARIALGAPHADTWMNLGTTLEKLERPDEALAAWRAALAIDPDYEDARTVARALLSKLGREAEAEAFARPAAPATSPANSGDETEREER